MTDTDTSGAKTGRTERGMIFTLMAGMALVITLFTPAFLTFLPVLVTLLLGIAAIGKRERLRPIAIAIMAIAVLLLAIVRWPTPRQHGSAQQADAGWSYGSDQTFGNWARIYTSTDLKLAPPYDGDNPTYLQVDGSGGVMVVATQGQFVCPLDGTVAINGWRYPCSIPTGYGNDHLQISRVAYHDKIKGQPDEPAVAIAHAAETTVTAQFFDNGYRDLEFATAHLKLELPSYLSRSGSPS